MPARMPPGVRLRYPPAHRTQTRHIVRDGIRYRERSGGAKLPITVISLDPGVTTGYAVGKITEEGQMLVVTGEARWIHSQLWGFFEDNKPDIVISERFEFRQKARTGLELYSRELIGVSSLYAQLHMPPPHEVVMQNPLKSNETTFFNDKRLTEEHIHKPGKGHANDAARHLLTWFTFRGGFKYNKKGYVSALS